MTLPIKIPKYLYKPEGGLSLFLFGFISLAFQLSSFSQSLTLGAFYADSTPVELIYRKSHPNYESLSEESTRIVKVLHSAGYLTAHIQSITQIDSLNWNAILIKGKPLIIGQLSFAVDDRIWLENAGLMRWQNKDTYYRHDQMVIFYAKILSWLENNGYPFARIRLDKVETDDDTLNAEIAIDKGSLITIDSIIISGNANISHGYLYRLYRIKPGSPYNEELISSIDRRNLDIPFATATAAAQVEFRNDKALIRVFLNKKNASRFDGIAGIMPNQEIGGKTLITGDVNILLNNALGSAELLEMNWKRLGPSVSDLKLSALMPFFLSSPFAPEYRLRIFRKDTSWISVEHHVGIRYMLSADRYFKLYSEWFRSDIISTAGMENITTLPPFADIKNQNFGLEVQFQEIDYPLNPRKGWNIMMDVSAGKKRITQNNNINPMAYNDLNLESNTYRIRAITEFFLPLSKSSVFHLELKGGVLQSESVFPNELFRLGGIKTLKGFDDESISASSWSTALVEYRFLLDRNSWLGVFWNGAYILNPTHEQSKTDYPMGAGAGISFETKAGIFSLYYALGRQQGNPLDFKSGKIHFGFANLF